jgi:hypothetical protein
MPTVNVNYAEARALRVAVVYWIGHSQDDGDRLSLLAARKFVERLDAVIRDLSAKNDPLLTWRVAGLEARTLTVVRAALKLLPQLDKLSEKFQ